MGDILHDRAAAPCMGHTDRSPWAHSSDQRSELMDYSTPPSWCQSPSPPRTAEGMRDHTCTRCATDPCECPA
jgi:hypothetical protein